MVDDDAVDRMAIKRNLERTQVSIAIAEAATCGETLALIQAQNFDCAFIDYRLPDGDGISLIQQLRQAGIQFPLIALTGQGDEQVAVDLMKAGASDYISKAKIQPDSLYRFVQQCMRLYYAEQEAERIKRQREELLEQREEFISRMTHDMQTPLVGANRMLELIQDDAFGTVAELAKEKMAIIMRSNQDLLKMVQDLVEVYTYDAAKKEFNYVSIDITELITEVFQQLEPLAQDKQLFLELAITDKQLSHQIELDRAEFKRVLVNLIGNSLKFTEAGGITVSVTGHSGDKFDVAIAVSDTGIGISKSDQTQLFKRFRRGKHKRSNSGLGLYLSHQIIEGHQGTITVSSEIGNGTTFNITLPAKH